MKIGKEKPLKYRRWQTLKLLETAGEISQLQHHLRYEICKEVVWGMRQLPAIEYEPDFIYFDTRKQRWIAEESPATRALPLYRLKRQLFILKYGDRMDFVETSQEDIL